MSQKRFFCALSAALLLFTGVEQVNAEDNKPAVKKAKPCSTAEYRQFDFWLGEWEVEAGGKVAGHNTIEAVFGGCALKENWKSAGGFTGGSHNIFNKTSGQWQQFWVDSSGSVLDLRGGLQDGKMVLEGVSKQGDKNVKQRITWTPNEDGSVRQHWEASKDDGKTWTTAFDGLYRKKG